jgi:hypothetical protein
MIGNRQSTQTPATGIIFTVFVVIVSRIQCASTGTTTASFPIATVGITSATGRLRCRPRIWGRFLFVVYIVVVIFKLIVIIVIVVVTVAEFSAGEV